MLRHQLVLMFFPALLLSLWLTPVAIRYSFRLNAVDRPDERKVHKNTVPRLGGVAIVVGLVLPLVFFAELDRMLVAFLGGIFFVLLTGFLDDVYRIPPAAKAAGEIAAAATFVYLSGISISGFGNLFSTGDVSLGDFGAVVTVFCMVGVMNALNLSDGLDGLAGGISAIACAFLGVFAYLHQGWLPLMILVALLGSLFGFLRYNTYPANLFMGDTGSLLLGYTLSAVAVLMVQHDRTGFHLSPVTVAAVLALPISDTLLVMARRLWHGQNPFWPDRTHLHHRLLAMGFPHATVVPILYVSMAAFGLLAWLLYESPDWFQFAAAILLAIVVHSTVFALQRLGYRFEGGEGEAVDSSRSDPAYTMMARVMGKSVKVAAWGIGTGLAIPVFALPVVPPAFGGIALAALVFIVALFPWRAHASHISIGYGLIYLACLCLLALLQAVPGAPSWVPGYLATLSALVLVWVLLKMRYRGHREIVMISSFEVLLLGIAFLIPLVLAPALGLSGGFRRMLLTVCLESAAFLLAMKILIRRQPRRNYVIVGSLLIALALIVAKGFLSQGTYTNFVASPAGASPSRELTTGISMVAPPSSLPSKPVH